MVTLILNLRYSEGKGVKRPYWRDYVPIHTCGFRPLTWSGRQELNLLRVTWKDTVLPMNYARFETWYAWLDSNQQFKELKSFAVTVTVRPHALKTGTLCQ